MNIFDSHCHLDDPVYADDLEAVIKRARDRRVTAAMIAGVDLDSVRRAIAIAERFDQVYAAVGIHPHDAKTCTDAVLTELARLAEHEKVRAWGEIGLDFNRMHSPRADQEKWFRAQLEASGRLDLPVIFHERDSDGRLLEILKENWTPQRRGVIHCFSGSTAELDAYLDLGLFIGITGIITIKGRGQDLRALVPTIAEDRLVVETDAPYLTPTPERNKYRRNEPAFVRTVLEKLAAVRGQDVEQLAAAVWANACRLYGLPAA